MKNILYVGNRSYLNVGTKGFLKGWKSGLLVNIGKFLCSWIRIRIPSTDPDTGEQNKCGSKRIRIHNIASHCCTYMSLVDISGQHRSTVYTVHFIKVKINLSDYLFFINYLKVVRE
jgi:hypothetical protein